VKKYNWMGMFVAFISTLLTILISRLDAFRSSAYNPLMIGLLLFAFSMVGFGVSSLFYDVFKKKKKKGLGSTLRKDNGGNDGFIMQD